MSFRDDGGSSLNNSSLNDESRNLSAFTGVSNAFSDALYQITRLQTLALEYAKVLVFVSFTTVGFICAIVARRSAFTNMDTNFAKATNSLADDIVTMVELRAQNAQSASLNFANAIGAEIASDESSATATWVNVPLFESQAQQVAEMATAQRVLYAPWIPLDQRPDWDAFVGSQPTTISNVFTWLEDGTVVTTDDAVDVSPIWQVYPPDESQSNLDILSSSNAVLSSILPESKTGTLSRLFRVWDSAAQEFVTNDDSDEELLQSVYVQPIYDNRSGELWGSVDLVISWEAWLTNILDEAKPLTVVVDDSCGNFFSYEVRGAEATPLGPNDTHDILYSHMETNTTLFPSQSQCHYVLHIYPTSEIEQWYETNHALLYPVVLVIAFVLPLLAFIIYELRVRKRHNSLMNTASRTHDIMSSFFPANVRERVLEEAQLESEASAVWERTAFKIRVPEKVRPLDDDSLSPEALDQDFGSGEPVEDFEDTIADYFPEVTVMFADIAGFTAWSSVREPSQVFVLLETLFAAFDEIARRRDVFKVETIGDCYVAAAGIPEPRDDHAVVMARYARSVITRMNDLTKVLEVELGPDTADLRMRIGLHSGGVTAGVLRGDKSRFQLFGQVMSVTAKIESSGAPNRVHISKETAAKLMKAGKADWCLPREEMDSFWLYLKNSSGSDKSKETYSVSDEMSTDEFSMDETGASDHYDNVKYSITEDVKLDMTSKTERLVDWNVDIILRILREMMARKEHSIYAEKEERELKKAEAKVLQGTSVVLHEVREICDFGGKYRKLTQNPEDVVLPTEVVEQVRGFVRNVAFMYRRNPFHNFEHASHVLMSTVKLLSRIVAPKKVNAQSQEEADDVKDVFFGIRTDPMARFACIFSALIHDVDHEGVPNTRLNDEQPDLARLYQYRSVAEQNSIDVAWRLFMDPQYREFRRVIYTTANEFHRFRQQVINCVMATDIMDKELKNLRNGRWDKAFKEDQIVEEDYRGNVHRKTTIVVEHLIQASDVSHTMQHWNIFIKWNERLFMEMHRAYKEGRAAKDPSEFWYKGEMGFFDFYIIPLASKLKTCGVFGVSCDEFLNYAKKNRKQWETLGEDLVASYLKKIEKKGYDEGQ